MKIFITGVNGQLGHDVINELNGRGHECTGSDLDAVSPFINLDITDREAVIETVEKINPDAVIHCAAWTAVDAAEDEENYGRVMAVNADGTENIAMACKKIGAKLMYISTDYVFGGDGEQPFSPDCGEYSPINVYGRSKLMGEQAVRRILDNYFIIRIAWVFGINGGNFVKTMLKLGKKYESLRVVCDQIGTPTYTYDLSKLMADMIASEKYGVYHATNEGGYISWYDFATEIFRQAGYDTRVIPVTTEEYGVSKAKRPKNSRLDKSKLSENGFMRLPEWKDALGRFLCEVENYGTD